MHRRFLLLCWQKLLILNFTNKRMFDIKFMQPPSIRKMSHPLKQGIGI